MGNWLGHAYRVRVVEPGREPLFLLLLGLLGSFLFIRFSVRMIRRGTKWWPGNVQPGGVHIHHVVFGQAMMLAGGTGEFAVRGGGRVVHDALAVLFGVGCGLVLDEFALVLHLEDVYWEEEGRKSVDAVILAVAVIGLLLIGQAPLGGYVGGGSAGSYVVAAVLVAFVVLSLMKGKVWTGLLGVMVPLLAVAGALRLARPGSPWARWRYGARPRRMARSERREDRIHRRLVAVKTAMMDAVAGAPTVSRPPPRPRPTIVDLPPSRLELVLARVLRPLRGPGAAVAVWYLRGAAAVDAVTAVVAPFRRGVRAGNSGEYVNAFLISPGFTGAVLAFVLSVSLRRRKRAAWVVAVVLVGVYAFVAGITLASVAGSREHPWNWASYGLTLLLLAALLVSRPLFNVRGERGNVVLGLLSLLIGAVLALGVGTLLVHATDQVAPRQWGASAQYAVIRVLTVSSLFELPGVRVPGWTDLAINVLSVALMLCVLLAFFRSPRGRARLDHGDERRLRDLLRTSGARGSLDSFGYFALRRDHTVCWSPDGRAAIAYRVTNGVALASGDPLGPEAVWPAAVSHWLALTHRHAWVPAVAYASPAGAAAYEAAGFRAVASGEEAVVGVADFASRAESGAPENAGSSLTRGSTDAGGAPGSARAHAEHGTPQGAVRDLTRGSTADDGGPAHGSSQGAGTSLVLESAFAGGGHGVRGWVGRFGGKRRGLAAVDAGTAEPAQVPRVMGAAGYRVEVRRAREVGPEEWGRVAALAEAWRRGRGGVELGRLGDPEDGACVVAECLDPQGRVCAVLTFVPWGPDGLTLDLVRRDRESGQGPVDFVLTEVLRRAYAGTAPLTGVRRVSFNRPRWPSDAYGPHRRPRYLLFERRAELPRVMVALAVLAR
jgi:lysyl-tRNA synthetase class 2